MQALHNTDSEAPARSERRVARWIIRPWARLAVAVALTGPALGMGGCAAFDGAVVNMFMISPEEELELGSQFETELAKELVFVEDAQIVNYVQRIGEIVVGNAPEQAVVPVKFHVVQNPEINAFAIPGGSIYVHTGLLSAAKDEAELASVMSHELGHVVYRHGAQHLSRQVGLGLIQQLALGNEAGQLTQIVTGVAAKGYMTKHGRKDELEADSIAIPTLYKAGYDPEGMVTFFETLKERYGETSGVMTWFASHPATSERIEAAQRRINALPAEGNRYRPVTDLEDVKTRMAELGISEP